MKYNFKYKRILSLLFVGLIASSCEKQLEEQKPQASLDAATAFTDAPSVNAGINGVYSGFQSGNYYGLRYQLLNDLTTDNINHSGSFPSFAQIDNNNILPDNAEVTNMYNTIYGSINDANTVIAAIPGVTDQTLNKDAALAELRTARALMYFDLVRYFGGSVDGYGKANGVGVSIKTTPTTVVADAEPIPRGTEAQVYTQVLQDLDFAIGVAGFANKSSVYRFSKDFATSLKSRVQLYRGQFAEAEALATSIISSNRYSLVSGANYASMWTAKATSEAIFELEFNPADQNFIAFFYYPSNRGGRNEVTSSASLNNAHETGDVRKAINFTTTVPTAKTAKAFRVSTGDDNVIILRLAELYLIRAEARVRKTTPDIVGALADLNVIRRRAGLANLVTISTTAILEDILKERRVELAHEGHRWFDLRRYNRTSDLNISEPFRNLWPIPQREVLTSGGIIAQNDKY